MKSRTCRNCRNKRVFEKYKSCKVAKEASKYIMSHSAYECPLWKSRRTWLVGLIVLIAIAAIGLNEAFYEANQ